MEGLKVSLYDVLDIIGDINSHIKFDLLKELSSSGVKTNKIKLRLAKGEEPLEVMNKFFKLEGLLSEIEYGDLQDRLC